MRRREFLSNASRTVMSGGIPFVFSRTFLGTVPAGGDSLSAAKTVGQFSKAKDLRKEPFQRLVILGESTVQGGPWLRRQEDRYADVLVRLINACQEKPV